MSTSPSASADREPARGDAQTLGFSLDNLANAMPRLASVPPQDGVGCHDRRPLAQHFPPESLSKHSQSTALIIVQPWTLAQLLAQNPNLLLLIQPDQAVPFCEHARQTKDHQLEWPKHIMHDRSLPSDGHLGRIPIQSTPHSPLQTKDLQFGRINAGYGRREP